MFRGNLYEYLVQDYGLSVPLYFSFLKLHFVLLILVFLIFGVYYSVKSYSIC